MPPPLPERLRRDYFFFFPDCRSGRRTAMMPSRGSRELIRKTNPMLVRSASQPKKADAAQPEHQSEKDARDHSDLVRLELGGIDQDGGEGRGDDQAAGHGRRHGPAQTEVGEREGEGRRAEDGEEDDVLPSVAVAEESAEQRPRGEGREEGEEAELRLPDGDAELFDQEEGEVAGHARREEVLREEHRHEDRQRPACLPGGESAARFPQGLPEMPRAVEHQAVPGAHADQYERGGEGRRREPSHRVLSVGEDDQRRQQRSDGASAVASHLEDGLRQALPPARGHLRHARGFGMEDRRAAADQGHRQQDRRVSRGEGQTQQSGQRETHAHRERIGLRVAVGVRPHEGLEDRGGELEHQRDEPYLGEGESVALLENRVHGRNDRLDHVVEQMAEADREQNRVGRRLPDAGMSLEPSQNAFHRSRSLVCRLAAARPAVVPPGPAPAPRCGSGSAKIPFFRTTGKPDPEISGCGTCRCGSESPDFF